MILEAVEETMKNLITARSSSVTEISTTGFNLKPENGFSGKSFEQRYEARTRLSVLKNNTNETDDFESILKKELLAKNIKRNYDDSLGKNNLNLNTEELKTIQFLHDFWA
ncbi:MAG: hypothetical protein OEZ22_03130 [Spirochaetia bacterium]|nr:hypothetical protein [Spirochaetia bacterium]